MLKCGHTEQYQCKKCKNCLQCHHKYTERADGWYVKCPTGRISPCIGPGSATVAQLG